MMKRPAFLAMALGGLLGFVIGQALLVARAAPSDVHGSPNVVVDVYKNRAGGFTLWANGRITALDPSLTDPDYGNPYTDTSQFSTAQDVSGRPKGSPNVAVGALPRSDGTFIVFADGTIKKPRNGPGAEPAGGELNAVWGVVEIPFNVIAGSGGFEVDPGSGRITFSPPFQSPPAVTVSAYPSAPKVTLTTGPGGGIPDFQTYMLAKSISASGFQPDRYPSGGMMGAWYQNINGFSFVAVGETD